MGWHRDIVRPRTYSPMLKVISGPGGPSTSYLASLRHAKRSAPEEASRQRVRELEEQIEAEREPYAFLDDLLTGSGDVLVQAVIQAFRLLGFADVRDADAEAAGDKGPRREDIRIVDARMPVLVETKGIAGLPSEEDALQVTKYLRPRMIEWDRTDVRGLAIINHQRNLPALDREHAGLPPPLSIHGLLVQFTPFIDALSDDLYGGGIALSLFQLHLREVDDPPAWLPHRVTLWLPVWLPQADKLSITMTFLLSKLIIMPRTIKRPQMLLM